MATGGTGYIEFIAGTGQIMGQDIWGTIDEQLHINTPELGQELASIVRMRTPIRSGSLFSDISHIDYVAPGSADLVWVYPEDVEQEAYWNRIYVQYQEGGLLGEATFTNDPHEMFYAAATEEGLDYTTEWARGHIQEALDYCSIGSGVPI